MRLFTVSTAAAIVLAAMLASAPAKADYHFGPMQNAGQCWTASGSGSSKDFGFWGACPQTASAAVATPRRHRHH